MTIGNLDRFEIYQKLAEPVRGPIWIDKDLHVPKLWHRLILSIFGSFACVRKYFNIDYDHTCRMLESERAVFERSGDARLVKIFNAAIRNLAKAAGQSIEEIAEPAERDSYNLTESAAFKEAFLLQNILGRHNCNRGVDQLFAIDSMRDPEMQTPENLRFLLRNCPNLTVFIFGDNSSTRISSEHLKILQENADRVTGLILFDSTYLSDEDLARLQSFQKLTHFSFYNHRNDPRLPDIILGMNRTNWQRVTIQGAPFTAEQLGRLPQGGSFSDQHHRWIWSK